MKKYSEFVNEQKSFNGSDLNDFMKSEGFKIVGLIKNINDIKPLKLYSYLDLGMQEWILVKIKKLTSTKYSFVDASDIHDPLEELFQLTSKELEEAISDGHIGKVII